jgi:pimeloyl-ACP methyl ester carboxylesterase
MKLRALISLASLCFSNAWADGPADNQAAHVRSIPPPGVSIPEPVRENLTRETAQLGRQIEEARQALASRKDLLAFLPDVEIFHKAVHDALAYDEIYNAKDEVEAAQVFLEKAGERLRQLRSRHTPWLEATGLVTRGYQSLIDGSIQPYGLVIPASYHPAGAHAFRLDFWFHGRGEKLTELNFLRDRERSLGEFTPPNTIVLHLYGRYCNANKFAGEIDLFEALEDVRKVYPIDENRLVVRGFSMGGAACWQFAVHYAGLWAAAAPGAGFSETADFLKVFQNEEVNPPWYEKKLWHLYDCTDYAVNLFQCPTVAYSGEIDRQKQAALVMAKALAEEGLSLTHILGPNTAHRYHPDAKKEVGRRIDALAAVGRNPVPSKVRFTTWTLRYNQMLWVTLDGLDQHWERARANAEIVNDHTVRLETKNVSALTLAMPPGLCPLDNTVRPRVVLDETTLEAAPVFSDRSWTAHFRKGSAGWESVPSNEPAPGELRKRHGLQGPIDDAFMESFLMVRPTGQPREEAVGRWADAELNHALLHWRRQFRGQARVKTDVEVTEDDIQRHNLILWGDPSSNRLLARIASRLPIAWDASGVRVGAQTFSSDHHVPVLIYPNPLNPNRYVVVNSGFTFREYDYLNNARQVPKLPDFAVIDLSVPVSSRAPGGIVAAGFFDEHWKLPAAP